MQAGSLTTPIEILRNTAVPDASGFVKDEWGTVYKRRAHVVSQRGSKALNSGAVWYPTARVVRVRKPLDIDEDYRLKIDGTVYEIISIDRLAKDSITINCQQVHEG